MAEREFDNYLARSGATLEGSRYTAYLAVTPRKSGFPMCFAICENRSFRQKDLAETAAAKALVDMLGLEEDGTPIFPEGYTGFDDAEPVSMPWSRGWIGAHRRPSGRKHLAHR